MTEETVEMVECALTGMSIDSNRAMEYTLPGTEKTVYVDAQAVLTLALKPPVSDAIIEKIALNDKAFEKTVKVRELAIAKNQGIQEGASYAVSKLKEAADKQGKSIDDIIKDAFPAPKEEVSEVEAPKEANAAH